ncbi:hypothetical protein J2Y39_003924 [Pseudomonas sp. 2957]|jgi:hypothetical protein|uniref:Uncharacterized protein n=1 Tax=Pseudomonas fluorescens TaxID=294 RepID=A0A5E7NAZ2_PSEFL|nr:MULTISPECIES: hypothetical protein [Pseudomonas]MDR6949305.1 hypothetical protein [Pseudomonas sp. 2957]WLG62939.1 hypothetical protein PSH90_02180 [Pseudomonas sp. FP1762]VVP33700.1 hypothetical protein PS847_04482 [Pseudomonas fluorescens]
MAKITVNTSGNGTVISAYTSGAGGPYPTYSITVKPDDNSGDLSVSTPGDPRLKVGDKVSFTISDGAAGRLLGNVTKI